MKSAEIKLFLVSDEGGTLKIEEVKAGPLKKSDLNSKVCMMHVYTVQSVPPPLIGCAIAALRTRQLVKNSTSL